MKSSNCDYTSGFVRGLPLAKPYDFTDKETSVRNYISYMLARTQSMFEYEGLPETIPQRSLELFLQTNGNVCIAEHEGDLYAFTGGPGGEPNAYYLPTLYVVSNPYLNLSKTYTIGKDCVIISSDSIYMGLLPMFSKYATQLVENDLSMNIVDIMARVISLISASDDRTKQSAEKYISDVFDGKLGVIAESAFLDGIRSQPVSSASYNAMTPLIEYQQYIKASWLNDIGLNANFNMKREALNSSESSLNEDSLLPLVDDMLRCREIGVASVNAMFGTSISVKLSSSWEDNQQEVEAKHEAIMQEAKQDDGLGQEEIDDEKDVSEAQESGVVKKLLDGLGRLIKGEEVDDNEDKESDDD